MDVSYQENFYRVVCSYEKQGYQISPFEGDFHIHYRETTILLNAFA